MLRVGLRGFGAIEKLIYWSGRLVEGLEFRPGITLVYGRSGCGKTLLALALHVLPFEVAKRVVENETVSNALSSYLSLLNNFINVYELLEEAVAEFCRPGVEVEELEDIGWKPDSINWACLRYERGDVKLHLVSTDGRIVLSERVKALGAKAINSARKILAQAATTISIPFNIVSMLYTLSYSEFEVMQKVVEQLEQCKDLICEALASRMLPLSIGFDGETISTHRLLGRVGVIYRGSRSGNEARIYLGKSLGEVKEEMIEVIKNLLSNMQSIAKEYRATPVVLLDDAFDGFTAKSIIDVLKREMGGVVSSYEASVYATTHRDVAALIREDKEVTSKVLVASYGLEKTSSKLGLQKEFRLALIDLDAVKDEEIENEIIEEFIGPR
jgi:DNA-binding ferritin-like protein